MKKTLALLLIIVLLSNVYCIVSAESKEKMEKQIVYNCSFFWYKLGKIVFLGNLTPQDCSWVYMEYNDRNEIYEEIKENPDKIQCFNWLPQKGYVIILGKVAFLCDSNMNIVGTYSDKDNCQVANRNSSLDALDILYEDSYIGMFFSGLLLKAHFVSSFDDIEEKDWYNTQYYLTDQQIQQIH